MGYQKKHGKPSKSQGKISVSVSTASRWHSGRFITPNSLWPFQFIVSSLHPSIGPSWAKRCHVDRVEVFSRLFQESGLPGGHLRRRWHLSGHRSHRCCAYRTARSKDQAAGGRSKRNKDKNAGRGAGRASTRTLRSVRKPHFGKTKLLATQATLFSMWAKINWIQ